MRARDFRRLAWTHLHGNWGTMALCTLIYSLIIGACAALAIFFVGGLAAILLGGAFLLGLAVLVLTTARGVAPRKPARSAQAGRARRAPAAGAGRGRPRA